MTTTNTVAATASSRRSRLPADLVHILRRPIAVMRLMLGRSFPADFRERIMLAVTQVNRCSICSHAHVKMALKAGVPREEITAILDADHGPVPADQQVAVLYAQHWADTQGTVDADAEARLAEAYDAETRAHILLSIRFINAMNLIMRRFDRHG